MQPRYGLTLKRNPTSGLSFVARISFVRSSYTWSSARGISSRYSTSVDDQGFGGLEIGRVFQSRPSLLNGSSVNAEGAEPRDCCCSQGKTKAKNEGPGARARADRGLWARAADGDRTRDPELGKLVLYHLSYHRKRAVNPRSRPPPCQCDKVG